MQAFKIVARMMGLSVVEVTLDRVDPETNPVIQRLVDIQGGTKAPTDLLTGLCRERPADE